LVAVPGDNQEHYIFNVSILIIFLIYVKKERFSLLNDFRLVHVAAITSDKFFTFDEVALKNILARYAELKFSIRGSHTETPNSNILLQAGEFHLGGGNGIGIFHGFSLANIGSGEWPL